MISHEKLQSQRGFTLVELLIVVIILAILAAIIVPQFTEATDDATKKQLQIKVAAGEEKMEGFEEKLASLEARAAKELAVIYAAAKPVPHRYVLQPVE